MNEITISKKEEVLKRLKGLASSGLEKRPVEEACVVTIDSSGSMNEPAGAISKIEAVKRAIPYLNAVGINIIYALVKFNWDGQILVGPTASFANIIGGLDFVYPTGNTSFSAGLKASIQALGGVLTEKKRIILLSDGIDNVGGVWEAVDDCIRLGIKVDTLAFGSNADVKLLAEIARRTGGVFFFVDTPLALEQAYKKLNYQVRYLAYNGKEVK